MPRNADELHDLLLRRGDLRDGRVRRGICGDPAARAAGDARHIGGATAVIAAEDAGPLPRRLRGDAARRPARCLPRAGRRTRWRLVLLRFARSRGPFTTGRGGDALRPEPARRSSALLAGSSASEKLVRGELRPGGVEREWCDPDVLRRLRRASLAALRREVEPAEQAALGRFLPAWHGIGRRATLREALVPLQALPVPVSLWESEVLPRRVPGYRPEQLDALCASGEAVWVGAGLDRVAIFFREDAPLLGAPAGAPSTGRGPRRTRSARHSAGRRCSGTTCSRRRGWRAATRPAGALGARLGGRGDERRLDAAPGGAPLRHAAGRAAPAALLAQPRCGPTTSTQGRWSLDRAALRGATRPEGARRAPAGTAGDRHARRRARRGHPRRLRRRLRGAARARDRRRLPARVLRRRPRRCPVRLARRGRAAARASQRRRRRRARARRRRPGPAVRCGAALAEARRCSRGPGGGRARRLARWRRGAVRRARRPVADPAPRARGGVARGRRWPRSSRTSARGGREAARGRAVRRRAGHRERRAAAARRRPGSSPARAAPCSGPRRLRCRRATPSTARPRRCAFSSASGVEAESPHPRGAATGVARAVDGRRARDGRGRRQEPPAPVRGRPDRSQPSAHERAVARSARAASGVVGRPWLVLRGARLGGDPMERAGARDRRRRPAPASARTSSATRSSRASSWLRCDGQIRAAAARGGRCSTSGSSSGIGNMWAAEVALAGASLAVASARRGDPDESCDALLSLGRARRCSASVAGGASSTGGLPPGRATMQALRRADPFAGARRREPDRLLVPGLPARSWARRLAAVGRKR